MCEGECIECDRPAGVGFDFLDEIPNEFFGVGVGIDVVSLDEHGEMTCLERGQVEVLLSEGVEDLSLSDERGCLWMITKVQAEFELLCLLGELCDGDRGVVFCELVWRKTPNHDEHTEPDK